MAEHAAAALLSAVQFRRVLRSLFAADIPAGFGTQHGVWLKVLVALTGTALLSYVAIN